MITSNGKINWHRDHSVFQAQTRLVNLGQAHFGYGDSEPRTILGFDDGTVIQFNCKVLHSVRWHSLNRFSIVLWKLKKHSLPFIDSLPQGTQHPRIVAKLPIAGSKQGVSNDILYMPTIKGRSLNELRLWCFDRIPEMQIDVSRYAPGRRRLWLFQDVDLRDGSLSPGYYDDRIWQFCQRIYPGCNVGLLTWGGQLQ